MRLLFAHDHRFQRGPGHAIFTLGSLPREAWDRYLTHFEHVNVVARDGGRATEDAPLARSDREGVDFQLLPSISSFRQLILRSPGLDEQIAALVSGADAVVARLPSEFGFLAIKHAIRQRKPYAVEVVGCPWDGYFHNGALAARIYAPLAFLRMRRAVGRAPLALYVTAKWLQKRYPARGETAVASNVELVAMDPDAEGRRAQRLAKIAAGSKPVLGTVASLRTKAKGIQVALAAIAELRRSGLEMEYRVLGPGEIAPWVKLAEELGVADLVHFDGTRSAGKGVSDWLEGIDIHLQPSFREGLPRATIEAMNVGVACMGSTCGGIPELLPTDRLHSPGDSAGLARQIRRLVDSPAALEKASWADRETARNFEPALLRRRRSDFYRRLYESAAVRPAGSRGTAHGTA